MIKIKPSTGSPRGSRSAASTPPASGHNSKAPKVGGNLASLQGYVSRIENVEGDEAKLREGKKSIYDEAKLAGHTPKAIRQIVQERKKKTDAEHEALLDTYRHALGMATYREVAEQFDIPKSTLHRLVPKSLRGTRPMVDGDLGEWLPDHDPTTGEIKEPPHDPASHTSGMPATGTGEGTTNERRDSGDGEDVLRVREGAGPDETREEAATEEEIGDRGERAAVLGANTAGASCTLTNGTPAASIPIITDAQAQRDMEYTRDRMESLLREKGYIHKKGYAA